jgi:hypothetical protein
VVRVGATSLQRFAGFSTGSEASLEVLGALVGFTWPSRLLGQVTVVSDGLLHSRGARVAGRWYFPAPSLTFAVTGWPPRSSADSARADIPKNIAVSASVAFAPVQSSCTARVRGSDLPLLGFVSVGWALASFAHRRVPLHRHRFRSPLPRGLAAPLRQRGCHPLRMFRPRGFSPPRRLPPPVVSRACCIPLPILGFVAFPSPSTRITRPEGPPRLDRRLPRNVRFVPLEG